MTPDRTGAMTMETGERLSAYLADELDADEHAALEAELAGDPTLRAQLERIRAANDALADLPAVTPPAEFSARLRETLQHEIAAREASPQVDELAQRRLRRTTNVNRFVGLGVAAALALVVGAIGLTQVLGGDDADRGAAVTMMGPEAGTAQDPLAAYVQVTDQDYDAASVQELAEREAVLDLPSRVDEDEARDLEASRSSVFGAVPPAALEAAPGQGGDPGPDGEGGTSTGGESGDARADTLQEPSRAEEAPGQDPFADVRRCLPEIVATASEPVIPLYAEVASFEGEPAIIYLVLTREPGDRFFNRLEAWVVARADCFPLLFQQVRR